MRMIMISFYTMKMTLYLDSNTWLLSWKKLKDFKICYLMVNRMTTESDFWVRTPFYCPTTFTPASLSFWSWLFYVLGYRRILRKDAEVHSQTWGANDVLEQDMLEELPNLRPICIKDNAYMRVEGNTHQAMWILTRSQMLALDKKCNFFTQSSPSR